MRGRICTIDVEDWYHSNLEGACTTKPSTSILPEAMPLILDLLDKHTVKATFFILADVIPMLLPFKERMVKAGHEIASHGIGHEMASAMSAKGFTEEVTESKKRLEDAFGVAVSGYRAPSWSINKENCGFLQILQDWGYAYDASVFPIKTFLYGFPEAPKGPFRVALNDEELDLVSVPCSTTEFLGKTVAFSGGFYLRALPSFLIQRFSQNVWSKNLPVVYYFHPREVLTTQPVPDLNFRDRQIHTWGLATTVSKLNRILSQGEFSTMADYVESLDRTSLPVYHGAS